MTPAIIMLAAAVSVASGIIGFVCGTVLENKLWMDAICGREKIIARRLEDTRK